MLYKIVTFIKTYVFSLFPSYLAINSAQMALGGGKSESAMQFLSFTFSFGGIIGPLITEPFLTPRSDDSNCNSTLALNATSSPASGNFTTSIAIPGTSLPPPSTVEEIDKNVQLASNSTIASQIIYIGSYFVDKSNSKHSSSELSEDSDNITGFSDCNKMSRNFDESSGDELHIHYAFIIAAALSMFIAIPFIIKIFLSHQETEENIEKTTKSSEPVSKLTKKYYVYVVGMCCLYYFLFAATDDMIAQFLSYFVVNQLDWSKQQGAKLTTIYFIFSALVKFVLIFVARHINNGHLLIISNAGMVIFMVLLSVVSYYQIHWMVWVSVAMFSAFISPIFGGGFAWMDANLIRLSGKVTAYMVIACAFGAAVTPIPVGKVMKTSPIAFPIISAAISVLDLIVMIVLYFFTKPLIFRKFGSPWAADNEEIDIEKDDSCGEVHDLNIIRKHDAKDTKPADADMIEPLCESNSSKEADESRKANGNDQPNGRLLESDSNSIDYIQKEVNGKDNGDDAVKKVLV